MNEGEIAGKGMGNRPNCQRNLELTKLKEVTVQKTALPGLQA